MKIEISKPSSLDVTELFGRVGKALEVYAGENNAFRCQVIELPPGKSFDPHLHISAHLIYVISGSGHLDIWSYSADEQQVRISEQSKQRYHVSKGDFFVIPKDAVHAMSASENETLRELIINVPGVALNDQRRIVWTEEKHG